MIFCMYICVVVFKSVFVYVCFFIWGKEIKEVIINNLFILSFKIVVDLVLVLKVFFLYLFFYFVILEIIE